VQEWKKGGAIWKYTTAPPGKGWQDPTFDDSHWKEGRSAFGTLVPAGTPTTTWNTPDIYLRYAADIPGTVSDAYLRLYHDEDAQIYLNGKQIHSAGGFNNSYEGHLLGPEAISAFKPGRNVIAVHCHQTGGGQCIDVGLLYGLK
jgi:hypothetical protein